MKIVGLMIARDEGLCCGMTVETAKDFVDVIVLVDNMSVDGTAEIVKAKCAEFGIELHTIKSPLTCTVDQLRMNCLNEGKKLQPDWFLNMDADTVFNCEKIDLRKLAEQSNYEQIWFRTLNLYGDMKNRRIGGLNIPHLWMFRNIKNIVVWGNYGCPMHTQDPNSDRLIGWNLNGIKYADHIFWRYQIWHARKYNELHKTNLSVDQYIKMAFTNFPSGKPTEQYVKCYVLNRLTIQCLKLDLTAAYLKLTPEKFVAEYMDYPKVLKEWGSPFELIFDGEYKAIGRKPDLLDVPLLPNAEIWQLHPDRIGKDPALYYQKLVGMR